jgi:cysteinyl-tRNA synthetase
MAVRLALLSAHYRQPMNLTLEAIDDAAKNLTRVHEMLRKIGPDDGVPDRPEVAEAAVRRRREFDEALDDDLNVSPARAALLGLVADLNRIGLPLSGGDAGRVRETLAHLDSVLGLRLLESPEEETVPEEVERLIEERNAARASRDFATADRIRDDLLARGIELLDTPDGTRWRRK